MAGYDPDQANLMVKMASKRRELENLALATAMAIGSSVGMTGNDKPLKAMERSIRGVTRGSSGMNKMRDHLHKLARSVQREG